MLSRSILLIVTCLLAALALPAAAQVKKPPKITYVDHVLPILKQKCVACHNPDKKSGDLDLSSYTNLMQGGGSGEVIEPGESSASYLYQLIAHDSEPYMPPESPKLPDEMIETVRKWIDGGVLENAGSKANIKKRKTFNSVLADAPLERPKIVPVPPRLSLEPIARTKSTTAVRTLATSPWAPLLAVAGQRQVLLYNTQSLELQGVFAFPEGEPQILKFSRNGSLLLAGGGRGGASGRVVVWDIRTGERVIEIGDELDAVLAADISSDQTLLALGGPQRVVRIYSTETGRLLHELRKHTDWICSLEFSPDSVLLATGDRNGGLFVWEGWTGREYLTLKAHTKCVTDLSWRSDSNILASGSEDGSIRLWEMENGGQVKNWGAHAGGVASIEFIRDGRIASCGRDQAAKLWDQNGGAKRTFEKFADIALAVTHCDETNRTIAADWSGVVKVWNHEGARVGEITSNPPRLAERLQESTRLLAEQQASHKAIDAAFKAANTTALKAKADLKAAQLRVATSKKASDEAVVKLGATKQRLAQLSEQQATAAKAAASLNSIVPLLTVSADNATAAAKKLPDNKELQATAAQVSKLASEIATELNQYQATAAAAGKSLQQTQANLAAAEKDVAAKATAHKSATELVTKLTPLVKPAEEKLLAASKAAEQSSATLAMIQKQVERWNSEIAFNQRLQQLAFQRTEASKRLAVLEQERAELNEQLAMAQAAALKAQQAITEIESKIAVTQQAVDAAGKKVTADQQKLTQAQAAQLAANNDVTKLMALLKSLQLSIANAAEAAKIDPSDTTLRDAVSSLKAAHEGKLAQLATAKTALEQKQAVVAQTQTEITESEKRVAAMAKSTDVLRKQAADALISAKPHLMKEQATRQAMEAKTKEVSAAQQAFDSVNTGLLELKGIR